MTRRRFFLLPCLLAAMALATEVHELGITAGPMDRGVQARGGLLAMDFAEGAGEPTVLDPACLPPLFLAFDPRGGEHSLKHSRFEAPKKRDCKTHSI